MGDGMKKSSKTAGGWFFGPSVMMVFFAVYFGFFGMDFGLKGNLSGSIGVTAGIAIAVSGVLYWAGQKSTSA